MHRIHSTVAEYTWDSFLAVKDQARKKISSCVQLPFDALESTPLTSVINFSTARDACKFKKGISIAREFVGYGWISVSPTRCSRSTILFYPLNNLSNRFGNYAVYDSVITNRSIIAC